MFIGTMAGEAVFREQWADIPVKKQFVIAPGDARTQKQKNE
jgi:hypothetical protein